MWFRKKEGRNIVLVICTKDVVENFLNMGGNPTLLLKIERRLLSGMKPSSLCSRVYDPINANTYITLVMLIIVNISFLQPGVFQMFLDYMSHQPQTTYWLGLVGVVVQSIW